MTKLQQGMLLFIFGICTIVIVIVSINTYTSLTEERALPTLVVYPSDTITPSPTMTFTATATYTSTSTPSPTLTATSTNTATATHTATPTNTKTVTPSQTATATQTASATLIPVIAHTSTPASVPIIQNTVIPPQNVIVINTSVPVGGINIVTAPQNPTATYTPIPSATNTAIPSPTPTQAPLILVGCIQYTTYWRNNVPQYVDFNGSNFLSGSSDAFYTPDCSGTTRILGPYLAYSPLGVDEATAICLANGLIRAEPRPYFVEYIYDCIG